MVADIEDLKRRVYNLENWQIEVNISRAEERVGRVHLDKRFDTLEKSLNDLSNTVTSTMKWFMASVGGAFITYIVVFALKGGFA